MTKTSHDSETLAEGKQVITACGLIHRVKDGVQQIFLPKRADTKKFLPGVFELPGGHIDFGEDIKIGLKREIDEEFGLNINIGDPFASFTYINEIKESHSIEVVFFATFNEFDPIIKLNPEDHSSFIWLSEEEIYKIIEVKGNEDIEIEIIRKAFKIPKERSGVIDFGDSK